MNKVIITIFHVLLIILTTACQKHSYLITSKNLENTNISSSQKSDAEIESIIQPYREPLEASMNEVIIQSKSAAEKGLPESTMGNLAADLLLNGANRIGNQEIDFAFLNLGGLRVEWQKGNITRSMVYELMPFENEVETVTIKGKDLLYLLNQIAARGGAPVAGIKFGILGNEAKDIAIQGKPIDLNKSYIMVSTDYLLNNGDKYVIPKYSNRVSLGIKFRDLLLDELTYMNGNAKQIEPLKDGRIYYVDTP